jgi:bifunctional enzyme CysN/CysC
MILDRTTGDQRLDHWEDAPQTQSLEGERSNVTLEERKARFGQQPATILLTGLAGAGKSTIAYALERRLFDAGRTVAVLDGQNMRLGISRDLGFSAEDRSENLRRGAEIAKLGNNAGLICICAFLAPSEEVRKKAATVVGEDRFLVVYLNAPVEVCRQRDQEGLYGAADKGEIANFPGVSYDYEPPAAPDLVLPTHEIDVNTCVDRIIALLEARGIVS